MPALIGFNYGGSFALFPAITADYFGNKNVGSNYGWMFTAYGVAGLTGPLLAGYFKDAAQGASQPAVWMTPFMIAGGVCLLGRRHHGVHDPAQAPAAACFH